MGQLFQSLEQPLPAGSQTSPSAFDGVTPRIEACAHPFVLAPCSPEGHLSDRAPAPIPSTSRWTRGNTCRGRVRAGRGGAGIVGHVGGCSPPCGAAWPRSRSTPAGPHL